MVKAPLVATLVQLESVYQTPVPLLELAVSAWPPAPAVSGAPADVCSCNVMTFAVPEQAPGTRLRGGVVNASRLAVAWVIRIGSAVLETPLTTTRSQYQAGRRDAD